MIVIVLANGPHWRQERPRRLDWPGAVAQQALGHNSKAVHRAYSKKAEVTVPSLDDWEKEWCKNQQRTTQATLVPVNFRSAISVIEHSN